MDTSSYPLEAYREPGVLWWDPPTRGRSPGAERRIAAWLFFNRAVGTIFTMPDLRGALGDDGEPNSDEHLNRRLRQLRKDGWVLPSHREDGSLTVGEYRVDSHGWVPWQGLRPSRGIAIPSRVRAQVLERDGRRCVTCGVGAGEPHPALPSHPPAVMTIGHRVPAARDGSSSDPDNLRVECSVCNEPMRDELRDPEGVAEVLPLVKGLRRDDVRILRKWVQAGERQRTDLDVLYDRIRSLPQGERTEVLRILERMVTPD